MRARLASDHLSLIVEQADDGACHLVWFGPVEHEAMAREAQFQRLPASPDHPVGPVLVPMPGRGFHGIAHIEGFCLQTRRLIDLGRPVLSEAVGEIRIVCRDEALGLDVVHSLRFDGDALCTRTQLRHTGAAPISVQRAASALIPAPDWADEVISHYGAWGREGQEYRRRWSAGRIEQTGRSGRPGFDGGPTLTLAEAGADERSGRCLTLHLAWSGPFSLAVERATDGSGQGLAERRLAPGEVVLQPGDAQDLPEAIIIRSETGFNGLARGFTHFVRRQGRRLPRPVHFNTWEARYFDLDEASCIALARDAATLGAERFVLDDGWFKGRRNDQTSLGDWTVDPVPFPNGLMPLIDAVHAAGMSFGLWVEPEMVSPDSDLYRAHPDWVLGFPQSDLATGRNQLVLDLALPEVQNYLFESLSALLEAYPISYLKWDCNRDLYPATRAGIARPGAQTEALYALLDRLRARFDVEIESCASGGGRIDAGIARYTDRFWTSDATDALDRLRIQRAAGLILPPERMGAHVGPSPNPMTGRVLPMSLRVLSAMFGHFGIEADPARLTPDEREVLVRGIAIYKQHRDWMQSGYLQHLSAAGDDPDVAMLIAGDASQALVRVVRLTTPARPLQPPIRLAGLEAGAEYQLAELALQGEPIVWPIGRYSGSALMAEGVAIDPGRALTGRLLHLERIG